MLPLTGFSSRWRCCRASADARELYALPLLLPLALLAVPAPATLRRGATNAWYWFSVMTWTFFIVVFWFYWSGLELGVPDAPAPAPAHDPARLRLRLQVDSVPDRGRSTRSRGASCS